MAKLPADNTSNYASLIISGRIGGWLSNNISYFQALVWNRDSTGIACIAIAGTAVNESGFFARADIVCYENSDATETVYIKCNGYYTYDIDLEVFQSAAQILYDGTYSASTPTGTLTASASASTKRITLVKGKLMVAGVEAKLTDTQYTANTDTIGSASAGTAIKADDITEWNAGAAAGMSVANGVLTFTPGSTPSLSYTEKTIPNISVTQKTVATGITAS